MPDERTVKSHKNTNVCKIMLSIMMPDLVGIDLTVYLVLSSSIIKSCYHGNGTIEKKTFNVDPSFSISSLIVIGSVVPV